MGYNPGISSYGSYGGMGSPYGMGMGSFGGYGSGYGGMGGYGAFGGYGGGYGGYGRAALYNHNSSDESTDFIRMAEESSRQAFQSIESIVHAFGSVSMMLESTYFAVHSSFRAVLGVADHFSKLRGHMTHVISSLAIIKTVNWFIRRLAFVLGVTSIDPSDERVWSEAERSASLSPEALAEALTRSQRKSSWPILIFFAVVFGTPWLIWKLLLRISEPTADSPSKHWVRGVGPHYRATGLFDFHSDRPGEVAFSAGQEIRIAPKQLQPSVRGWLLASDGTNVGLVPSSYVRIIEMKSGADVQGEENSAVTASSSSIP
jgi:peroxin-13